MDFIIGLPISKGFVVIWVVVDRLSKFGHFISLKSDFSSTIVMLHFYKASLNYMIFQNQLVQIEIGFFLDDFRDLFSKQWELYCQYPRLIIHSLIAKKI